MRGRSARERERESDRERERGREREERDDIIMYATFILLHLNGALNFFYVALWETYLNVFPVDGLCLYYVPFKIINHCLYHVIICQCSKVLILFQYKG